MTLRDRIPTAALLMTALVVPFLYQRFRYDRVLGHQPGAALVLLLIALPFIWQYLPRISGRHKVLAGAIYAWVGVLFITTIFALSPEIAFVGAITRKMGVLQHLIIGSAVLFSPFFVRARMWRWYWAAVILVAVEAAIAASGEIDIAFGRPKGLMSWTTFTGPWLSMAMLWAGTGFFAFDYQDAPRLNRLIYGAGLLVGVMGLFVLGARAAVVLLAAGTVTAALTWAAFYGYRRIAIAMLVAVILGSSGIVYLSTINNQQGFFSQTLLSRIQLDEFRQHTWSASIDLMQNPPDIQDINGEPDRWHSLRPVLGYGLENFKVPFFTVIDPIYWAQGTSIDRAHNEWMDTVIMTGLLGLAVRIVLWGSAVWLGLTRLGLANRWAGAAIIATSIVAFIASGDNYYLPIAVTLTALFTMWLYLVVRAVVVRVPENQPEFDKTAWIALTLVTAHIIGLQFNFVIFVTDFPAWLALGLLLIPDQSLDVMPKVEEEALPVKGKRAKAAPKNLPRQKTLEPGQLTWIWAGLVGAAILRWFWGDNYDGDQTAVLLVVLVVAAVLANPIPRRLWLVAAIMIPVMWAFGYVGYTMRPPEITGWWDMLFILAGMALLVYDYGSWNRTFEPPAFSRQWAYLLVILLGFFLWERDIRAHSYVDSALRNSNLVERIDTLRHASKLSPWDNGILMQEITATIQAGVSPNGSQYMVGIPDLLDKATAQNAYDPTLSLWYVSLYLNRAEQGIEVAENMERSNTYFEAAHRLSPNQFIIQREWARYWLMSRQNAAAAKPYIDEALGLYGDDQLALTLQAQINATLAQQPATSGN